MSDLRLAVIGAGIMGANHARVCAALRDVELVGVVDPDMARAAAVASAAGTGSFDSLDALVGRVDAAVVSTPTETHVDIGTRLLDAGIHVLIEKPIAPDLAGAGQLVAAAARNDRVLMVGHIERFNPAVLELKHLLDDVLHIDAARISPYSSRIRDDVIIDLMIHDLDIILSLAGEMPTKVQAVGQQVRSDTEDLVSAVLEFPSGLTASVLASRVGQNKIRQLQMTQRDNYVTVDLVRQDVTISRVDHSEFLSESGPRYRQSGVIEIPFLEQRGEPLALELAHFVECVRRGTPPEVGGAEGACALDVALQIKAQVTGRA